MNKLLKTYLVFMVSILTFTNIQAQSFNGYQTIGQNTFFFSAVWTNHLELGIGYNYRFFGTTFTDFQTELRFPIDNMYQFEDFEVIAGIYRPNRLRRTFIGTGAHVRLEKNNDVTDFRVALSAIPSYVYSASLNDGAYGTIGGRITYSPAIISSNNSSPSFLKDHQIQVGGHFDLHLERTLGLSLNSALKTATDDSQMETNLYVGMAYRL